MKNKTIKELTLKELQDRNKGKFFGGAGYNGADDYENGIYTGKGEREFLERMEERWFNEK